MSEQDAQAVASNSLLRYVVAGVVSVFMIFSGYSIWKLQDRIGTLEEKQAVAEQKLGKEVASARSEMESSAQALAQRVGMTQKELAARTAELQRQARAAEKRLSAQQEEEAAKLGAVTGDVAGIKTDMGGVRTDLGSARTDIDATKAKLDRTIGDLGIQSGLIAHTRDELEVLKHRGDRNYYEFTLAKKKRTPVGTVSLELKKADPKHSKYSMVVTADDRPIEKKDRTMNEPVQFYTGRDRMLYELVVYQVEKNKVIGYLSTPKTAPQPISQ